MSISNFCGLVVSLEINQEKVRDAVYFSKVVTIRYSVQTANLFYKQTLLKTIFRIFAENELS